jgi:hypothetical protein
MAASPPWRCGPGDGHGEDDVEAGDLDQEGDLFGLRVLSGKTCYLGLEIGNLGRKMLESGKILADPEMLGGGNGEGLPPGKIGEREGIAIRGGEVVAEQEAMEAIGDHGTVVDQSAAVGEEAAGIADDDRRYPDLRGMRLAARRRARAMVSTLSVLTRPRRGCPPEQGGCGEEEGSGGGW